MGWHGNHIMLAGGYTTLEPSEISYQGMFIPSQIVGHFIPCHLMLFAAFLSTSFLLLSVTFLYYVSLNLHLNLLSLNPLILYAILSIYLYTTCLSIYQGIRVTDDEWICALLSDEDDADAITAATAATNATNTTTTSAPTSTPSSSSSTTSSNNTTPTTTPSPTPSARLTSAIDPLSKSNPNKQAIVQKKYEPHALMDNAYRCVSPFHV